MSSKFPDNVKNYLKVMITWKVTESKHWLVLNYYCSRISVTTVWCVLHKQKTYYSHSCRKRVLGKKDLKSQLTFAQKIRKVNRPNFMDHWASILFRWYRVYSQDSPFNQAMSSHTMMWHRSSDGLSFQLITRGFLWGHIW